MVVGGLSPGSMKIMAVGGAGARVTPRWLRRCSLVLLQLVPSIRLYGTISGTAASNS
jgi:hypothetical protein